MMNNPPVNIEYDCVIIGCGAAGLSAAIEYVDNSPLKKKVAIIGTISHWTSHTAAAQGGINASFGSCEKDDWRWHMHDTLHSACGLADSGAVAEMCYQATDIVRWLENIGVQFDKNADGSIYQRKYGGQKTEFGTGEFAHRACCCGDKTGDAIIKALFSSAEKNNINFLATYFVIDLIIEKDIVKAILAVDLINKQINIIKARAFLIASGGYSGCYEVNTCNSSLIGDIQAVVFREKILLKDMEFVQFHPTSLYPSGELISEAARGEGGYLINKSGNRFMKKYHHMQELAPRDIIARAIFHEINKTGSVYLDIRHLTNDKINKYLPKLIETCKKHNIDPLKDFIPVAPAAHYCMGGIYVDENTNVINNNHKPIKNLFCSGEAACLSVHGANRLGCNSLLETVVFGKKSGKQIKNFLNSKKSKNIINGVNSENLINKKINQIFKNMAHKKNASDDEVNRFSLQIKRIINNNCNSFRNKNDLQKASRKIKNIIENIAQIKVSNDVNSLINYCKLKNQALISQIIIESSLCRNESRGSHFRIDHPQKDDINFRKHSVISINDSNVKIDYEKVKSIF